MNTPPNSGATPTALRGSTGSDSGLAISNRETPCLAISRREIDYARLYIMESRRGEMVADLINNRRFNPVGAAFAVDNLLATLRYVLEQTGALPR